VNSQITDDFRRHFAALPEEIKEGARKAYKRWRENPRHPSLHFKKVNVKESMYSIRVALGWRALGKLRGDTITWYWIGSHADYDKLIV
jgi:hypothetical protein